jgi:hypothetical protein
MIKGHTRRSLKALASATAVLSESAELAGKGSWLLDMAGFALLSRSAAEGRISLVPDLLRDTLAPQKVQTPPMSACKTLQVSGGLCVGTLTKARTVEEVSSNVLLSPARQDMCLERMT